MSDWNKLVGKRVLIDDTITGQGCDEKKVIEVSPSGKRVKFRNGKNTYWEDVSEIKLIEVLT